MRRREWVYEALGVRKSVINQEREDLNGLLSHPGFHRLKTWIEHEFMTRCLDDIEAAYETGDAESRERRILQVFAGQRTARAILGWPASRIAKLEAKPNDTQPFGRGGF